MLSICDRALDRRDKRREEELSRGELPEDETLGKLTTHFDPSQCRKGDCTTTLKWLVIGADVARRRRRRLKGIHSRSDTNRTGAEGLSFYYPRLLHCLNQMLAVVLLSQHRVSSSRTVRPHAPCGARCIGHAVSTWSAVCSEAPHSQFGEGARPHLCMDEWNRPTPVCRRLSLTQAVRGKPIPTAWHRSRAQKHGAWKHFHSTPFFICGLSIQKRGCQVWQGCPIDSCSWHKRASGS